ncbi:hypothetical protein DESAMIL20_1141 [Desulfurella amilsii]|uniref:TonB C-terminal domain-containing protein n=1 Tax=Desulfurella amilsii TaxID=1562698 RepID=A0A1X4XVQ0_9BACT|nr:energy transducer TonB [Desulfurella amilsii]OSS41588.1 hypothetical protein DESAMIL20_1141 [Desulfurella amilsii]
MQQLATHSKKLYISWALAFVLNIVIAFAFARAIKLYTIKTSKVYAIYLVSQTGLQNTQQNTKTKNNIENLNTQKKLATIKTTNTKKSELIIPQKTYNFSKTQMNDTFDSKINIKDNLEPLDISKNTQNAQIKPTSSQTNSATPVNSYSSTKITTGDNLQNLTNIQIKPQIANWIENHKFYPQEAVFKGEEGKIQLVFVIDKNGFLQNISILKKSPYDSLNKAAIKIVHNSSPVPHQLLTNVNLPFYAKINIIFKLE